MVRRRAGSQSSPTASPEVLTQTANSAVVAKEGPTPTMNIWEMEEEPVAAPPTPTPSREVSAEGGPRRRPTRTKTRVLGFEPQAAAVVPLFDEGRMEGTIVSLATRRAWSCTRPAGL